MHQRFFSIIVPCYNEERLIDTPLPCLTSIDYPKDRCEIIVVENGSTDRTFEIAKKYAFGNCRVYQSPKGVSRARNFGISMCAPNTECAIWLDADTFLKPDILNAINAYLHAHPDADFGTTDVYLDDETRAGRFWSWYINVTDRFLRIMHRIHIVRSYLLDKVEYDVDLGAAVQAQGLYKDVFHQHDIGTAEVDPQEEQLGDYSLGTNSRLTEFMQ